MPEQRDVKVFISWSGELGRSVAVALRDWLPILFDRVQPWVSDTDIAAGQRGLAQIEKELLDTQFGIVVVTAANQEASWLNFEAGALSKAIPGQVERRVVPLLVDLSNPSQLTGPLSQFQAKSADRQGLSDLLRSLGTVAGIEPQVVDARFDAYWGRLEEKLRVAVSSAVDAKKQPTRPRRVAEDVLDEILLHVRAMRSEGDFSVNRARSDAEFRGYLDAAAERFGFMVLSYPGPRGTSPRMLVVTSVGDVSPGAEIALQRYINETAGPGDRDIEVAEGF